MEFKKFEGANFQDIVSIVKKELGPDAVIVSTRHISGGLFGKKRIEVTAGVEQNPLIEKEQHDFFRKKETEKSSSREVFDMALLEAKLSPLWKELRSIKGNLKKSNQNIRHFASNIEKTHKNLNANQEYFKNFLKTSDIDEFHIEKMLKIVPFKKYEESGKLKNKRDMLSLIEKVLLKYVSMHNQHTEIMSGCVAMVGPTGVGKTTTIAKIAAHAVFSQRKKTALITMDTYRIGATEQLRQYAELMKIPFFIVKNEKQFHDVMENMSEMDLVLIDTAGRGPGTEDKASKLGTVFAMHDVSVQLVLSASSRSIELKKIIEKYKSMSIRGLVFTKMDEAFVLGGLINACMWSEVPVSCVTFGQRVPEDIAFPDAHKIVQEVIRKTEEQNKESQEKISKMGYDYSERELQRVVL
jgi:flagellar biosynthesis protein FlhF